MTKFSDLNLDPKVLKAVADAGYETPTPIQAQAIPHALEGRDVLGIAQTGTGKTAGFVLPLITILAKGRARARMPRSLILCPTRELAAQVAENFVTYSKNHRMSMALLIGGVSFKDQDRLIDRGVDVLIATPGRLLDHFERGKLMLTGVQDMVVDEADRMLDMGFIPDIERIFKLTPFTRQTLFFSATMAPEITRITEEFLHNPVRVEVARQATASETITQALVEITPSRRDRAAKEKRDVLRALIEGEGDSLTNAIIFCNRKVDVDIVAKSLKRHGHDANPIHGDLEQSMRMRILSGFRDGDLKLLVASDVAARGLDIPNVSHVFNFDVPIHAEDYVHRIGRTGRAGRSGKAITLSIPASKKHVDAIEALLKTQIPRMANPLATAVPTPEQKPEPAPAPKPEAKRPPQKQQPKPQPKAEKPAPKPRNERRQPVGRNGRAPLGLGDHVPAFMLLDFRAAELLNEPVEAETKAETLVVAEPVADIVETPVVETPVVETPAVETPAEEAPVKPKRKPRARKKVVKPVAEETAEAVKTVEPEEKPKKAPRKKRVTKKPKAEAAPVEEATPKAEEPAPIAEPPKVEEKPTAAKPKRRPRIMQKAPVAEPEA